MPYSHISFEEIFSQEIYIFHILALWENSLVQIKIEDNKSSGGILNLTGDDDTINPIVQVAISIRKLRAMRLDRTLHFNIMFFKKQPCILVFTSHQPCLQTTTSIWLIAIRDYVISLLCVLHWWLSYSRWIDSWIPLKNLQYVVFSFPEISISFGCLSPVDDILSRWHFLSLTCFGINRFFPLMVLISGYRGKW